MGKFCESEKDETAEREGWAPHFIAVPKIQWTSNLTASTAFRLKETFTYIKTLNVSLDG